MTFENDNDSMYVFQHFTDLILLFFQVSFNTTEAWENNRKHEFHCK